MDYDRAYRATQAFFGAEPEPMLVDHCDLFDPALPVLDIGCGQGRHAIYLARRGLQVHALDPSRVAIDTVTAAATLERLPIEVICARFQDVSPDPGSHSGVLVFGLIQELDWETNHRLVERVRRWVRVGGIVCLTAFTVDDPACAEQAANWAEIGPNSYRSPDGDVRTYLEPGQIVELFAGMEVVHHWEGLGPEHRHGDQAPERHAKVEAVLRRV